MQWLCARKISVDFEMCFNGSIRRPWVWKLHWRDLKGLYFGKVDFINTFLMDFCILLHISGYSGKTMEECNARIIEIGKNSDVVYDYDYSSDSKAQLYVNFPKNDISVIEKYSTAVDCTWHCLSLLPVFGTICLKYTKLWLLLCLSGNLCTSV